MAGGYDYGAWKKSPPDHLPAVGSLVRVSGWDDWWLVVGHKPTRYAARKPKRWNVIVQNPGSGVESWLRFPHEAERMDGWWGPGDLLIHPPDGEPYDPAAGGGAGLDVDGLVGFKSNIKPKKLREFYRMLQRAGYEVSFTRGNHVQVKCPEGVVYGPSTSNDPKSWRHVKAECVRHGVPRAVFEDW